MWSGPDWRDVLKRGHSITVREARIVAAAGRFYEVEESEWNNVVAELWAHPEYILGWTSDYTEGYKRRLVRNYHGVTIARGTHVTTSTGVVGSTKTGTVLALAWLCHLAKAWTRYLHRVGTPPEWRRFSPHLHYIPDVVQWDRKRTEIPNGASLVVDDPSYLDDAENEEAFETALRNLIEYCTKARKRGIDIFMAEPKNRLVEDELLESKIFLYNGFKKDGVCSHAVYSERDRTAAFRPTGFIRAPDVRGYIWGPCAVAGGRVWMEEAERRKDEAHGHLFLGGRRQSYLRLDLIAQLLADPVEAVQNSYYAQMRVGYILRTIVEKRGYKASAVALAETHWKNAMRYSGYHQAKEGQAWALEHEGRNVFTMGTRADVGLARAAVLQWVRHMAGSEVPAPAGWS